MLPLSFIENDTYKLLQRFTRNTIPNIIIRGESGTGKKRNFFRWWDDNNYHTEIETLQNESTSVEFRYQYDSESIIWDMQYYINEDDIIYQKFIRNYMITPHILGNRKFIIIDHAELLSDIVMQRIGTAIERYGNNICYVLLASNDIKVPMRLNSRILYIRVSVPTMDMLDEIDNNMNKTETDGIRWLLYKFYGYVPLHHYQYYIISTNITMDHDSLFQQLIETMRSGHITGPIIDEIRQILYTLLGKLVVNGSRYMFLLHWILRTGLDMTENEEIQYEIIDKLRSLIHPMLAGSRDIILLESAYWKTVGCLHQLL